MSQNLLQPQQIYNMFFENLSSTSKIWIYTSDRELSIPESEYLQKQSSLFVKDWAAHGVGLKAGALVYRNRFLILAVDESQANASGCSIDSSVKFVKAMASEIHTDFFNRMNLIVTTENGELESSHVSDLKSYMNHFVYNPMITTLSQLRKDWLIPVASSPFVLLSFVSF